MSMNNDKVRLITSKQYIYLVETAVSFKWRKVLIFVLCLHIIQCDNEEENELSLIDTINGICYLCVQVSNLNS
jgi:hypothetical protein